MKSGTQAGFQLHVLNLCWTDFRYRYTTEEVWPILAEVSLDNPAFLIDETDIRLYDWQHQEIWLTSLTMTRLHEAGGVRLLRDAVGRAFIVTLNHERLYGGLFYDPGGAAAIRFPVIHSLGEPVEVLRIRPALGSGWEPDSPHFAAQCQAIADPSIFTRLAERNLLGTPAAGNPGAG